MSKIKTYKVQKDRLEKMTSAQRNLYPRLTPDSVPMLETCIDT